MEGDGLQIFIYLLVIVASIVGGIVKNSAKKKEEAQRRARQAEAKRRVATEDNEPKPKPSNPFEEFLRRQLEEFEEVPVEEEEIVEVVSEPDVNTKEKYTEGNAVFNSTSNALLSDNMKEEGFSISNSLEELENEGEVYNFSYEEITEDEITDKKDEEEFFNARKALIYSEIFKRPEY
jgi:hypothetical protein